MFYSKDSTFRSNYAAVVDRGKLVVEIRASFSSAADREKTDEIIKAFFGNAGGAEVEDGLSAAQEYLIKFEDDVSVLVAAGCFESDGSVLLRAADVQRMRP